MNFKTAKCDRTNEEILLSDGFFVVDTTSKDCSFVSINTPENHGDYSVSVSSITKSPEAFINWMAHLG